MNQKDALILYTDGACSFNGTEYARAGIGVFWGCEHPNNISEPLKGPQTNNRAEIHAAIRAINQAAKFNYKSVAIFTDSHYVYNCATSYIAKWQKNNWISSKKKPVKNKNDLLKLVNSMKKIEVYWHKVTPKCVMCNFGIKHADKLAKDGIYNNYETDSD